MTDDGNRSAGDSPAVAGAPRPRFGEVEIRDRGRLPYWEAEGGFRANPEKGGLADWKWLG